MDVKKKLGERIRFLRRLKGMTQEQLAEKAEVSVTFIGLTERGKNIPSVLTCAKIAEALGVSLADLFHFDSGDESEKVIEEVYLKIRGLDDEDVIVMKELADVLLRRRNKE